MRPEIVRAHLAFLADDALEGRGTGSRGYDLAAKYLRTQLQAFGSDGGAADGGYFQTVPLVRTEVDAAATSFELQGVGASRRLAYGNDYALIDTHGDLAGQASGRVVFVGYGVTAPERNYDDYAGLNVDGAIVVFMAFSAPPSFPPTLRAYYSNLDVKRANAVQHGAVGALALRGPAEEKRFPWPSVLRELQIGWNSMRWLGLDGGAGGLGDGLQVMGLLNRSGAEALFADEERQPSDIFAAIEGDDPPRFALSKEITIRYAARHQTLESPNVIARFEGSDPELKNEYVLYTAHADHLGIGPVVNGDDIYNGAMDNASGCAVLLEIARAFGRLAERPKRSVLFAFVTGEEQGLLGSDYFAHYPTVPLGSIVANINVDGGAALTPVSDVFAWGSEHSSLGGVVEHAASATGFSVSPDPFPEEGLFVRSDQFSFVKQGVPALFLEVGVHSKTPGVDALALLKNWLVTNYHSPMDDVRQPIDYETSARFAGFAFAVGQRVATDQQRPQWNQNDFFGQTFGHQ